MIAPVFSRYTHPDYFSKYAAYYYTNNSSINTLHKRPHFNTILFIENNGVKSHDDLRMRSVGVLMTPAGGFVVVVIAAVDIVKKKE